MGGSQKSKRVNWASDVNLCQVRLFLSEESPSQVGLGTQDHLQAKTLWPAQAGGMGPDDNLPPGFEGIQPTNPWTVKLSQVPLVKWKSPVRFEVNRDWQVAAGEESREAETQNQRELRVLEAIYPRPSAIPPNPAVLVGAEDSTINDQPAPVVPITPIEDEDASLDTFPVSQQQKSSSHRTFPSQVNATANRIPAMGVEPDIVAAAQAALSSVMSNSDQGNLIDRELLIKILSDPKMIEQLITNHAASSSTQSVPSSSSFQGAQHMPSSVGMKNFASSSSPGLPSTSTQYTPVSISMNRRDAVPAHITRPELAPLSMASVTGPFYPPGRTGPSPNIRPSIADPISAVSPPVVAPITKDINYYKSLIQQHGGERREPAPQFAHQSQEAVNMMTKPREKPKIMKPCIYFNSPRGCRNGANCSYQHDVTTQQKVNGMPEVQSSKRVKLDREITGS